MSDRDPDFDAISEADIFIEARDRQRIAEEAETEDRKRAKEDLTFCDLGNQWPPDKGRVLEEESPRIVINLTKAMVRRVVNNIKQQRPRGKTHPVGDGADVQLSEVMNDLGRHVEARSTSVAYDTGAESQVKMGWGYWRVLIEYVSGKSFMQDIKIAPIYNTFSVYMDPAALEPTGSDAGWCLIVGDMKRTEYKRKWPAADNAQWVASEGVDREGWESEETIRLAEYFRIREIPETLLEIKTGQGETLTIFESDLEGGRKAMPPEDIITKERETTRKQVEWFRLNGTKVVKREILPGTWIPIIRVEGDVTNIDGKVTRQGMVHSLIDPARMVNYGESAKVQRLGLAPKSPWIAAEGQLDGHPEWETSNREPHAVLIYKPVTVMTEQGEQVLPPPQRNPPAQIEQGFSEMTQAMRTNLIAVAGMPMEPGADTDATVVSGKAIQRRDKLSDQSHFHYYDKVTLSVQQTWRIILEYIRACYTDSEARRAIGEDGVTKMVDVNKTVVEDGVERILNDLSVGEFDITMDTGAGYETRREEGSEALLQLLQSPPLAELIAQHGADLVFRSLDHPYMQELADRLQALTPQGLEAVMEQLPERAKSFIRALAGQLQQAQQALQQAQLENKYHMAGKQLDAEARTRIAASNDETKRADTESRERTQIVTTAMKIHGELGREEIGVGGKILDTHARAAHEAVRDDRQAERLIQRGETAESTT